MSNSLNRGGAEIYGFATLGQKIEWLRANPLVCVEADEIIEHYHWVSVVAQGHYEELEDAPEWMGQRILAYGLLQQRAMWWEPANIRTAVDELVPVYYRIHVDHVTGRRAKPDPFEDVTLVERATTQESGGWLKSLLRRARILRPGHSSH